jgi:hypothetical protein
MDSWFNPAMRPKQRRGSNRGRGVREGVLGMDPKTDSKVQVAGNVEITDFNYGIVLTSPNKTRYLIKVDNSGILSTTVAS